MMKTEKRKANVGERILITNAETTHGKYENGDKLTVTSDYTCRAVKVGIVGAPAIFHREYEVIVSDKPKKSARITALESQVATLQAKVEALEKAGKYPLTERFNQESAEVDAIMTDIKRKAKPTLESILATYPTPNEQRADVIKRAKAFVTKCTRNDTHVLTPRGYLCNPEFHVNTEKRVITFLAKGVVSGNIHAKAIAKCDPDDVFNADIGKAIALARALGVEVPVEFVKAVQPTEKVAGQYVTYEGYRVNLRPKSQICNFRQGTATYDSIVAGKAKITDDTDAVYE